MNSFKEFVAEVFNSRLHINRKTGEQRQHRHMADIIPDVSTHSKTGGLTVPEYCKTNNNAVQPFEELKRVSKGIKHIAGIHAKKLADLFGFNLPAQANEEVRCGNTGISIKPHPVKQGFYILQK